MSLSLKVLEVLAEDNGLSYFYKDIDTLLIHDGGDSGIEIMRFDYYPEKTVTYLYVMSDYKREILFYCDEIDYVDPNSIAEVDRWFKILKNVRVFDKKS